MFAAGARTGLTPYPPRFYLWTHNKPLYLFLHYLFGGFALTDQLAIISGYMDSDSLAYATSGKLLAIGMIHQSHPILTQ